MIARNLDEYLEKAGEAVRTALNSEAGQELTGRLLEEVTKRNQSLTAEEWEGIKQEFMVYMFREMIRNNKEARDEMALHTWEALRH